MEPTPRATRVLITVSIACLAAFAAPGIARTQETQRYIPPAGTRYLLRIVTDTLRDGVQISHEERDLERVVISSDRIGGDIRGTIVDMRGGPVDRLSPDEKKLYMSVLSADITQTFHYMMPARSASVFWPMMEQDKQLPPRDRIQSVVFSLACDEERLAGFFPIGQVIEAVVPCELSTTLPSMQRPPDKVETTLDALGPTTVSVPAGDFAVQTVRLRQTFSTGARYDATSMFSTEFGLVIRADGFNERTIGKVVNRTVQHIEMLHITPAAP